MANLSTFYLRLFLLVLSFLMTGCKDSWYAREYDELERRQISSQLVHGSYELGYQGSAHSQLLLGESIRLYPENAAAWREKGIPYLKRGIPDQFEVNYGKAVALDPVTWVGWRGYIYLYFYRDYERAILDFNALDTLTPDTDDFPQGQSVDYMRGIAYSNLGQYETAEKYFSRYIDAVASVEGEEWTDLNAFLYRGINREKGGDVAGAISDMNRITKYDRNNADAYFHRARMHLLLNHRKEAAKELIKAKAQFEKGFYHQRPYVYVWHQLSAIDIAELETAINLKNLN